MPNPLDLDRLAAHHSRIRRLARALVRTEQEAEDLVQDAWVRAIERGPRDPGALGAWLSTVVRRLAGNAHRGTERRRSREREAARPEALPSSEDIAARVDIETRLLAALESLEEPHRTVLRDRYLGGLDPQAIAERDGRSVSAVRSALKRARAALRERLESEGLGGDVHWRDAIAPLILGPAGGALTIPGGDGASSSSAASGSAGSSSAAATTLLLGGTLAMKKIAALVVVAALGVIAWRAVDVKPTAAPNMNLVSQGNSVPEEEQLVAPGVGSPGAVLVAPDQAFEGSERAAAAEGASEEASWPVAGRFRIAGGGGLEGVAFTLAMYEGMESVGEPLGRFAMTTGPDGRFTKVMEQPAKSVCFEVEVEDHAQRHYSLDHPYRAVVGKPAPEIDVLVFVRNATVTGTVVDEGNRPVADAYVEGKLGKTRSQGDGTFELAVSAEAYGNVTAWADGLGFDEAFIGELEPGGTAEIELRLPAEVILTGTVRDAGGGPIADAAVRAGLQRTGRARTDAAGRFRIGAVNYEPGKLLRVTATSDSHGSQLIEVEMVEEQREYAVDFELERGIRVEGTVLGPSGDPAPGVEVWAGWTARAWDRTVTFSADDGTFSLDGVPAGSSRIGANLEGLPGIDEEIEFAPGTLVSLQFEQARTLRGRALDEDGAPVAGILVAGKRDRDYLNTQVSTDSEGRFELGGFPKDGRLSVELYGAGWVRVEVDVPEEAFGEDSFVITVPAAGSLSGLVTDAASGAPLSGFTVRIGWPEWPNGRPDGAQAISGIESVWHQPGKTFDDADGRWSTGSGDELTPGRWGMVEVSAPGYAVMRMDAVEVMPISSATELSFELVRPFTAQVTLTAGGDPVAGARLIASLVENPSEADPAWTALTGVAGVAQLEGVAPGALFVRVQREGLMDWKAGPLEVSSASSAISIELPAGAPVEVQVLGPKGSPLAAERVTLAGIDALGATGEKVVATTGEEGRARFDSVTPGTWRVSRAVGGGRFPSADLPVDFVVDESGEAQVVLIQPTGRARVTVSFEGDTVPPDETALRLVCDGVPGRAGEVHGGRAILAGVVPGRYRVEGHYYDSSIGESMQLRGTVDVPEGVDEVEAQGTVER